MRKIVKKLPKSQVELTIEVSVEELQPFLDKAVKKISEEIKIAGFRPGKAPYNIVAKEVGEMKIYETALEQAVRKTFVEAVLEEKLETIGQPKIDIEKLAPKNPLVYKATVALLPEITLGKWQKIKVKPREVKIEEEKIDKMFKDLQKMQSREALVDREIQAHDKAVVDMEIFLDKVPVEGGQTKDHAIYFDEEYYIKNLKEKILGAKKGEVREFKLLFPKDHFKKNLAGREVDFKVTVKDVFAIKSPILDDEFAKTLGQKSLADLRELLNKNLTQEAEIKEKQRSEIEILEKIGDKCRFGDIPEVLVDTEIHKMVHELEENISRQGLKFEDYLKSIKKTHDELKLDFISQALKRVKTSLITRAIAQAEKIEVKDEEVDKEVEKTLEIYQDKPELYENIKSEDSREYLKNFLATRKVMKILREKCLDKVSPKS